MMKVVKTRGFLTCLLMVLAATVAFLLAYPHLPTKVPAHWNFEGVVDRYGSPLELLWVGPGMMLGMMAFFTLLARISPQRFQIDGFMSTYLYLMQVVVALFGYIFALLLWVALGGAVELPRAIMGGTAVLVILTGNVLGKVRRNFFIGVRTPWTLASERVWYATHRLAARLWVGAGLLSLLGLMAGLPVWCMVALWTAAALLPVLHSLLLYQKLARHGELDGPG